MITLEPWTPEDEDWTIELWQNRECRYEWGFDLPLRPTEQREWLNEVLAYPQSAPVFLVVASEPGIRLGIAMLDTIDWHNRSGRVRVTLVPTTLERIDRLVGSLQHVVREAFETLNLYRLWAVTSDDQPDHHDALMAVGFQQEARRRRAHYLNGSYHDELSWSLLRPEWPPAQDD